MKNRLEVKTESEQTYPVIIEDTWPGSEYFPESDKLLIVIDQNVARHYGDELSAHFESFGSEILWYEVPFGESSKSIDQYSRIIDYALKNRVRRNTPLVAVGGGVTGDLAGFAAASILRGLPLYHLPTTLLAMVDSSIGGKTGINHTTGKNLIGAFYQPELVWANMQILETLPHSEWNCGMGEVLKYGCISNHDLLDSAEKIFDSPDLGDRANLKRVIEESARIKIDIVSRDEKESGIRAYLNFGHTFAHAIEAFTGYTRYSHGEAVFVGLVAALWLSEQKGAPVSAEPLIRFARYYKLNTLDLCSSVKELVSLMGSDKKNLTSKIRLVTLSDWQNAQIVELEDTGLLESAFQYALERVHNPA